MYSILVVTKQAADDFSKCINKLSDDKDNHLSKEMIKKLFSIKIEDDISHSIYVRMIQRPVVPHEIAEMFDCPEVKFKKKFSFFLSNQQMTRILFYSSFQSRGIFVNF